MSKQFLQKPRYEYYKGTTEVVDNELNNFVEDVVDRLNEQYFSKRELLRVKQNQDEQILDLQHKLKVAEIATKLACERVKYFEEMQDREMGFEDLFGYESHYDLQGIIEQYKEQAEKEVKGRVVMEEKERFELFGEHCIKDNNPDARPQLLDAYVACVILNEQNKHIKELEEENKELKEFTENTANLIDKLTEDSVFASTQLAIEKLEKIKEKFTSEKWDLYDTPDLLEQVCELRNNHIKYIDNQIKELGGEKNE